MGGGGRLDWVGETMEETLIGLRWFDDWESEGRGGRPGPSVGRRGKLAEGEPDCGALDWGWGES